ncbi:MAG: hypothetical protein H0T14_02795 [Nocardioidaceae bacterium]|nr:hypothetical protein [Nocardioidaceae bacterium]
MIRAPRPQILAASILVALEALGLFLFAAFEVAGLDTERVSIALTTGIFFGLYAGGLLIASVALWRLKGWSRGPIVLAQLIQLGVAWSFAGGATRWVAVILATWAVLCLGLVLSPSTTAEIYPDREQEDDADRA